MRKIAERLANGPVWIRSLQHLNGAILNMIQAGHVERTKPARGRGRNMVGLTAAGAAHYGLTVEPGNLIEPLLERIVKQRRRPTGAEREQHKAALAEHIAEGGTVATAAPVIGMSKSYCQLLWGEIRSDLGWQAQ